MKFAATLCLILGLALVSIEALPVDEEQTHDAPTVVEAPSVLETVAATPEGHENEGERKTRQFGFFPGYGGFGYPGYGFGGYPGFGYGGYGGYGGFGYPGFGYGHRHFGYRHGFFG